MFAVFHRRNMQEVNAAEGEKRKKTGRKDVRRFLNEPRPYTVNFFSSSRPPSAARPTRDEPFRLRSNRNNGVYRRDPVTELSNVTIVQTTNFEDSIQ